jgi:hypothetical protein
VQLPTAPLFGAALVQFGATATSRTANTTAKTTCLAACIFASAHARRAAAPYPLCSAQRGDGRGGGGSWERGGGFLSTLSTLQTAGPLQLSWSLACSAV